jgi:putative PEP-CTERM system TPR-repeat lipoprotein
MNRLLCTRLRKGYAAAVLAMLLTAGCGRDSPQELVKSAQEYIGKGDANAAVIQLRNALQKAPDNAEARYLLGTLLTKRGDSAGAVKELRRALELGYPADQVMPELAKALISDGDAKELVTEFGNTALSNPAAQAAFKTTLGDAFLSLGKPEEAEAAFTAALALKPDLADASVGIATLRAGAGDLAAATKIVDGVIAAPAAPPEAFLLKAQLLYIQGQRDAAREVLEKLVEARPDLPRARYRLAALLIEKGDFDGAKAQVAAMRSKSKQDPRAYYLDAMIASRKGDLPAAREAIQQVLKGSPQHVPSLLLAGDVEYRAGQFNQARDYLRRALKEAPGLPYAKRLLAATYLRLGSPAHALEELQPLLNRGFKDPQLMTIAGETYLQLGDLAAAGQYFAQATALAPKNAEVRTRLGQVRFAEGDTEGAIEDLEAASALDSNAASADLALVVTLLRQKEFDKALDAVARLEKKQPNSPLPYNLRGLVYLGKRDVADARANFERALKVQADYLPAIINLATLDRLEKKPELARKRFETILEKEPKNDQAILALANLEQSLGDDPGKIEALIKRAIAANPQSMSARVALVTFYIRQGDGKQALLAAQDANSTLPDDPRTLDLLGRAQLATGDATLAVGTFSKLVAARPDSAEPLVLLARSHALLKEYDRAIEKLREALKIKPDLFEANRDIVVIYAASGRPEQALQEIRTLERQRPNDVRVYVLAGDFWVSQKKWSEAEAAYAAAQKRAPDDAAIAIKVHAAASSGGKTAGADSAAERWLRSHPNDVVVRAYLAERALRAHDYRTAAAYYLAIVALQPENAAMLNNLAWVSGELGHPEALSYAQKALSLAPRNPSILDTMGTLLVKKGDVAQGIEKLRQAAQAAPNQADIRLHLAEALIKAGDKTAARKELEALAAAGSEPAGEAAATDKDKSTDQKGAGTAARKGRALSCNAECQAEVTALLKTL